ncbi:MAG: type IV pilus twitching motility protein PilT [Alphaproteobacteria bacterium]|nr:type IV pilus twitching motility protein PilT [Alphaproteobacteria bacterium]
MDITDLLVFTQRNKASDLHLSTGNPPILRVNGEIITYQMPPLTGGEIKEMLHSIMTEQQRTDFERDLEVDFAISFDETMRFRINAFNTLHGPAAVMRSIPATILSLDTLNAPKILERLSELHNGLILVTGPTGSGKSTTLAAMVDHINTTASKHILTIEDPVEFVHVSKKSLVNQREIGRHTHSFSRALKSSLREDPDVILVGELRDLETIQLALTAAETGHLVLGTMHTNSAPETVDRIIDVFPAESKEMVRAMLSVTIQGVVTQTLLKRRGGGRVAAHEIMLGTPAVRNLIREGKVPQMYSMIQMGSKLGMCTMKDSINHLYVNDLIDEETARAALVTVAKEEEAAKKDSAVKAPRRHAEPQKRHNIQSDIF